MDVGKSVVAGAAIIAATGALTAWAIQPRYTTANPGGGVTIRLNRSSGDMIGCERLYCRPIVAGNKMLSKAWDADPIVAPAPVPAAEQGSRQQP